LGAVVLAVLAAAGPLLALSVLLALGLVFAYRRESLAALGRPIFWIFALITVTIGALLFGPAGTPTPSWIGAILGLEIVARAAAILVMARWIGLDATAFEFAHLFERFGLRWVGFALGVAINALPILERSSRRTWDAMRMRGGLRRRRLNSLRLIFIATLTNALLHADAQADAATTRGFRLDLPPEPPPAWLPGERALAVGGWVAAVVVAVVALR
jgi:energy-coupling factor transporter transmembrane protein EcfT